MCTVYVLILEYAILAAWEGGEYLWAGDLILELQFAPLYVMVPNPFLQAELTDLGFILLVEAGSSYIVYANSSIWPFSYLFKPKDFIY